MISHAIKFCQVAQISTERALQINISFIASLCLDVISAQSMCARETREGGELQPALAAPGMAICRMEASQDAFAARGV